MDKINRKELRRNSKNLNNRSTRRNNGPMTGGMRMQRRGAFMEMQWRAYLCSLLEGFISQRRDANWSRSDLVDLKQREDRTFHRAAGSHMNL